MNKKKAVRKKADTKRLTISTETYDRLFACAMKLWEIEKKQLRLFGVDKALMKKSGMTEKQVYKSIGSNPPCPEATAQMAVGALEKKIERYNDKHFNNKQKTSTQTLH